MRRAPRRRAFTLVELLIVVAIIALLISIGLPSLRRARKQAKAVVCGTHLHAQAQALQVHFNEYGGLIPREYALPVVAPPLLNRMPYAGPLATVLGYTFDMSKPLESQFAAMPEFQCPDFPRSVNTIMQDLAVAYPQFAGEVSDDQVLDFVFNDFQLNYERKIAGDEDVLSEQINRANLPKLESLPTSPSPIVRLDWIRKPNAIIYVSEAHAALPHMTGMHDVVRGAHLPRGQSPRVAVDIRHPAGIHVMYLDGHIERALPEKQALKDWYDPSAHAVSR